MIELSASRGGAPVDRSQDRRITLDSIVVAVGYVLAGGTALLLPEEARRGTWLPIHLALAGGALTAVAGVMPYFVAAFAAAPPVDGRLRAGAIVAVSVGALAVAGGVVAGQPLLPVGGGLTILVGIVMVGAACLVPVGRALGPSRGLVTRAYLVALAAVGVGVVLAILLFAGWAPIAAAWPRLRPAHAWLNLFGFVSLVIATTLLHFFPTVVGARIANHRSGRLTIAGVAAGAWLAAAGFATGIAAVAAAGAVLVLAGALALARYASLIWRTRGRWTTDLEWHRFAMGGLASAIGWFVVGAGVAALDAAAALAAPAGPGGFTAPAWSIERVAAPLIAGWAGLAVLASATHLVPAVGPGGPAEHARQRRLLGRLAVPRLAALNLGVAGLLLGAATGQASLGAAGAVLLIAGAAVTAALLVAAISRLAGRGETAPATGPAGSGGSR